MKILLLAVGRTNDKDMAVLIDRYTRRISHYAPFEFSILPDVRVPRNADTAAQKDLEGRQFLSRIQPGDRVILLDERGREFTSREFSEYLDNAMLTLQRNLIFVIGGPYGFSPEMYQRADGKISLSRMTFSHEMVRLFFTEQIYRAFTIIRGEPYHHD